MHLFLLIATPEGGFHVVDWDTANAAISEALQVAAKVVSLGKVCCVLCFYLLMNLLL
jgi:hypothetical protein